MKRTMCPACGQFVNVRRYRYRNHGETFASTVRCPYSGQTTWRWLQVWRDVWSAAKR